MAVLKTVSNHRKIKMMAALCIVPIPQPQPRKAAFTAIQLHTEANPMNPVNAPAMADHADSFTYVSLLQACIRKNDLAESKLLHAQITQTGFTVLTHLHNTLLNVYVRCGSLADARRVFDQMPERDVCSWTVMIAGYARQRVTHEALGLFFLMQREGVQPNKFTFASVLPACADSADIKQGLDIHEEIRRSGLQSDVFVANALIDMYAKCGSIEDARYLFDKMCERDVVSWTALIAGYAQNGQAEEAMELFKQMWLVGLKPNSKTYASVLPGCADLEQGMEIHGGIIRSGFQSHVFVESALVDMYARCGSVEDARHLFAKMRKRDIVSWAVMIAGVMRNGWDEEALKLFRTFVRGWFALRFGNADHTRWVLSSSWCFENDLVLVKRWTPLFDPETEQIGVGPVWIRLPGLPLQYWSEDVFRQIGNSLGTFMEFDKSYQTTGILAYARILVHLDTREDLQGFITIQWRSFSRKQRLDYEGIPHRCRKCDQVGHLFKACPLLKKLKQAKQEQEQELPVEQPPPQAEKLKRAKQEQEQELPAEQPPPQAEKLKRAKQEQEQELPAEQPPPQAEKLKQVKQEQELPAEQPPPQAAETSRTEQNKTSDTVEAPRHQTKQDIRHSGSAASSSAEEARQVTGDIQL